MMSILFLKFDFTNRLSMFYLTLKQKYVNIFQYLTKFTAFYHKLSLTPRKPTVKVAPHHVLGTVTNFFGEKCLMAHKTSTVKNWVKIAIPVSSKWVREGRPMFQVYSRVHFRGKWRPQIFFSFVLLTPFYSLYFFVTFGTIRSKLHQEITKIKIPKVDNSHGAIAI